MRSVSRDDKKYDKKMLTGSEIRRKFLDYFVAQGHREVRSSSLVPANDPTLLFANAGMNQFKDVFLGLEQRDYKRATSSQKCVRAGGKHNDLENVGFTNRHHTFFEMLGNFSFGDYFKKDAIAFAWELITSAQWFGIPTDKLYFTVFGGAEITPGNTLGTDEEAAALWKAVGAPENRILAIPGLKENFWAMGDTGPCGPCSEIHYDMGPEASDAEHADCKFPCDCGRYVEVWNLVFMQFNRDSDGKITPLPRPSIDTGAGLERLAAVLQGAISNYDTDLFRPLMERTAAICQIDLKMEEMAEWIERGAGSLRVIADHARASTFLISDGVVPSNDGRGYVLRKIIRRALRHGKLLGAPSPLLAPLSDSVRDLMRDAYPELDASAARIKQVLEIEESRFERTLDIGLKKLEAEIAESKSTNPHYPEYFLQKNISDSMHAQLSWLFARPDIDQMSEQALRDEIEASVPEAGAVLVQNLLQDRLRVPVLNGRRAFRLYDTYGLPRDFIEDAARDGGLQVDWPAFDQAMQEQRTRARASWKGGHKDVAKPAYAKLAETFRTEPDFYFGTQSKDSQIEAILTAEGEVDKIPAGTEAEIVLDRTVFFAESGGQVADTGSFFSNDLGTQLAEVRGAYYPLTGLIAHRIVAKQPLRTGERVASVADAERREHIKRNHTATHLMHAALRNILGTHVKQAGSLVEPGRLRFDFSHFAAVDRAELRDIEDQVNEQIRSNAEISTDVTTLDDALASGALAFFGDRYPESNVRVVTIPDPASPRGFYSKELCGGTHVRRSGEVGAFKIVVEQASSAGVRRIEALTGQAALLDYQHARETLAALSARMGVGEEDLLAAAERAEESRRQLEKQLEALKRNQALAGVDDLLAKAQTIKGVKVIAAEIDGADRATLRAVADGLRQKLGSGVVVLGAIDEGKVALLVAVTKDLTPKIQAGKLVQALAKEVGGSGGGRPDLAEAGGKDTSSLKKTLDLAPSLIDRMYNS
jgi:alanyl-tRNA synthetase